MKYVKNLTLLFGIFILSLTLSSCWWRSGQPNSGVAVINVLDEEVYNDCHIIGSVNVLLENIESYAQKLDKTKDVVVYCSNYFCTSSDYAAKQLQKLGFEHVWVYKGGTAEWYQQGLPVEGPCRSSYLKKVVQPVSQDADDEVSTISTQDLARKLGVSRTK